MVQKSYLQFKFYINSDLPYAFRFVLLLLFLIEIYQELIPEQLFEERERIRDLWLLQQNQFLSWVCQPPDNFFAWMQFV